MSKQLFFASAIFLLTLFCVTNSALVNLEVYAKKSDSEIYYADQFSGADLGEKIMAALSAIPESGGIIDATRLTGTQQITAPIVIDRSNIKLLFGQSQINVFPQAHILIRGKNVEISGRGAESSISAHSGSSSTALIRVEGDHIYIHDLKLTGNLNSGGRSSGISITGDFVTLEDLVINDSGGFGISSRGLGTRIIGNTIKNTGLSAIFFASGASNGWVERNYLINSNISGTDGQGGIVIAGNNSGIRVDGNFTIIGNNLVNSKSSGITINSGGVAAGSDLTNGVLIKCNLIQDMLHAPQAGEGITFTADNVRVVFNTVIKSDSWGINNFRESQGTIIAANKLINIGQDQASWNSYRFSAIRLTPSLGALIKNALIIDNIIDDDQEVTTTVAGIAFEEQNDGKFSNGTIFLGENTISPRIDLPVVYWHTDVNNNTPYTYYDPNIEGKIIDITQQDPGENSATLTQLSQVYRQVRQSFTKDMTEECTGISRAEAARLLVNFLELATSPSLPLRFIDVPPQHPYYNEIQSLVQHGITGGCSSDNYCPFTAITRAQFLAMILRGLGIKLNDDYQGIFADVKSSDWYALVVETAYQKGIINGCEQTADGSILACPNDALLPVHVAAIFNNARKYLCRSNDLNCDGVVNLADLLYWRALFAAGEEGADTNSDGQRDILDYLQILRGWL